MSGNRYHKVYVRDARCLKCSDTVSIYKNPRIPERRHCRIHNWKDNACLDCELEKDTGSQNCFHQYDTNLCRHCSIC